MVAHTGRAALVLTLVLAAAGQVGCGREVLISGVSSPATGGHAPDAGAGGQGPALARAPACDESGFDHEGLPGAQLASSGVPYVLGNWGAPNAIGDWNGDGVPDFALPNYSLSSVSVVLGWRT